MKRLTHSVTISLAPVVVILDDQGDPVQALVIGPMSALLWLPCAAYTWLTSTLPAVVRYGQGWAADLRFIAQAAIGLKRGEAWVRLVQEGI